ncbi:NADP-dependent phosphogluconate dehydrogenase [Desulfomicrobium escambiense]|uniref:NADP-dependent phosphogluconate dehydrogenase n=1 Tax=Desulfomicrobium escambiense TaxID=29503 RepID=UPI0004072815|nr:NADP-dependent phosphogluconate dehydrogenase [Desulfomicrobium escambiense]
MYDNDIAVVGLAVMGQNLALNMARHGLGVTVYNRTWEKTEAFMAGPAQGASIIAAMDLKALAASLKKPRAVFLMVKAGSAVDDLLDELLPWLEPGDIVMDGGNSHFEDTTARVLRMRDKGVSFLGVGVSGGEKGALLGPSIMPGGPRQAWERVAPMLAAIAAKTGDGRPCTGYMGRDGAGHFVKMVHNGIEYGVMQLLAEAHDLLLRGHGMEARAQSEVFDEWNAGSQASFLLEITADILARRDALTDAPILDVITDTAGSKGTGLWTSRSALTLGVPVPTITAAVEARMLSNLRDLRRMSAPLLPGPRETPPPADRECLGRALFLATLAAYAQGFALIRAAEEAWGFGLDTSEIARVWREGCIIRAAFLDDLVHDSPARSDAHNILLSSAFDAHVASGQAALRRTVSQAANFGVPVPGLASSLAYYDSLRSARLPANLIQAQRDYFGAHGFERTDMPGVFHGPWEE